MPEAKESRTNKLSAAKKRHMYNFALEHPTAVLSTVSPDATPHASVVYYALDDDFNALFVTKEHTRKHENLTHNSSAMILVYDPMAQVVLQIQGSAEKIADPYESQMAFASVMKNSMNESGYPFAPISKMPAGPYIVYRLKPEQFRLATYGHPRSELEVLEDSDI